MSSDGYAFPRRNRGKPGELTLMIGLSLAVIPLVVLAIIHGEADEHARLKTDGMVAEAEVIAHDQRQITRTDRKGRDRSTTAYLLEVRYDVLSRTHYAGWAQGTGIVPSQYPALSTTTFEVSQPEQAASPVGSRQMVAFLSHDPGTMKLVTTVEAQTSFGYFLKYYLAMGALMVAGLWLARRGWRQRRAGHG